MNLKGYKIHWHILVTHFPISFFIVSFGFMFLHLFTDAACFETSSVITLAAGALVMIPTTLTGRSSWKNNYRGAWTRLFRRKINISFAMVGISFSLTILRAVALGFGDVMHPVWHVVYFTGATLLMLGAIAEGYFGGRINHR